MSQELTEDLIELMERYNNPPGTPNEEFVESLSHVQRWFLERRLTQIIHGIAAQSDKDNAERIEELEAAFKQAKTALEEVNDWAVCGCLATPEDMMQNLPRIIEITDVGEKP